jgi:hypothetical protein
MHLLDRYMSAAYDTTNGADYTAIAQISKNSTSRRHIPQNYHYLPTHRQNFTAKMRSKTLTFLLLTLLTTTLTLATAAPGGAVWGGDKATSDVSIPSSPSQNPTENPN